MVKYCEFRFPAIYIFSQLIFLNKIEFLQKCYLHILTIFNS